MIVAWPVVVAALLLLAGFVLRARLRVMQVLYMPASVLGGLLGLVLVQGALLVEPAAEAASSIADAMSSWPGLLIAVVFAGLLLERPRSRDGVRRSGRSVLQAGVMVWIIVLGEVGIGLLAAGLVIAPVFGLPPIAGQLIEAGFAGGHGTSAALGQVYAETLAWGAGRDLAFFMATAGLVWSVVSGIALVNIGIRRGWTRGEATFRASSGLEPRGNPTPSAMARVAGDALDPLVFQIALMAVAFGIGAVLRAGFSAVASPGVVGEEAARYLGNLPLFLFTLFGGWILRHGMTMAGVEDLIDTQSVKRIVAVAMEFLIVAAIASLRVEVIGENLWPLLLLCGLGFGWAAVCLIVISPRVLPAGRWFELGLINYGMSTGTTAQGMMLVRTVDRELESGAAEDYALAAPLSAPFIGGGVITLALPLIVAKAGAVWVGIGALVAVGVLYGIGRWLRG